jgi:hypothetical protein
MHVPVAICPVVYLSIFHVLDLIFLLPDAAAWAIPSGVAVAPRRVLTALAALTARVVLRAERTALHTGRNDTTDTEPAVWVVALRLTGWLAHTVTPAKLQTRGC